MTRRLAPFLDLLDARYLPLLCVVAPQAYTVYAWLLGSATDGTIAVLGGLGYELVYVGAIAWAERGAGWQAARYPAITALIFSVAVAVAHYAPTQGALAVLHAGFPLVGYWYVALMHAPVRTRSARPAQYRRTIRALIREVRALRSPGLRVVSDPSAHACRKCGASVDSQQQSAASARWGCAHCRAKKVA